MLPPANKFTCVFVLPETNKDEQMPYMSPYVATVNISRFRTKLVFFVGFYWVPFRFVSPLLVSATTKYVTLSHDFFCTFYFCVVSLFFVVVVGGGGVPASGPFLRLSRRNASRIWRHSTRQCCVTCRTTCTTT